MIVAMACVPQAPLLLPGLTGRPVAEVEEVRAAMRTALKRLLARDPDEIVVVGAAPATREYPADGPEPGGRLAPDPARRPLPGALPVPLAVGRALLGETGVPWTLQGVDPGEPTESCRELGRAIAARPGRTALLVAADGGARRGEKAPGYIDPRARKLDARIAAALRAADSDALLALDPDLCADLLVAGRAAWQVMAAACAGTAWTTRTRYEGDPFGVAYWVLTWA